MGNVKEMIDGAIKNHETRLHKRPRTVFTPPTIEEIDAYCIEKGITVLPGYIWNFYDKKGWKVGKNLMKNWKSAVSQAQYWESAPRRKLLSEQRVTVSFKEWQRKEWGEWIKQAPAEKLPTIDKDPYQIFWLVKELRPELAQKQIV